MFPHLPIPDSSPLFPKTAYEIFNLGLSSNPSGACLGYRGCDSAKNALKLDYTWEDYQMVDRKRTNIGSGLITLFKGLTSQCAEKDTPRLNLTIGIWSVNRPGKCL